MSFLLHEDAKIMTALDYASGTADRNGTEVDMTGFDTVTFVVKLATIAAGAVTSVKVQRDTVTGMAGAADMAGTAVTIAADDDDEIKYITVHDAGEQFVRLVMDKDASNACAESAIAILYNAKDLPVTQPAGTEGESHIAAGEGTA